MFFPQKQTPLTLAMLISFFMTQDACATKRVAPALDEIEHSSEQRRRLTPEVTFESRLKAEYDQRWARLLERGLERRQDILSRNTTYQACESVKYRLQWVLKNQGIPALSFPLKMRNLTFLSKIVGCSKAVCSTLLLKLSSEGMVTESERSFFMDKTVRRQAFKNIVVALQDKQNYEGIITVMAQDGIFNIRASRSWFIRFLNETLRKNYFPGSITRADWEYLKQRKTADVHKDPELRVKELVRQQLEALVGEGVTAMQYIASKNSSHTLIDDFYIRFRGEIQRCLGHGSYREHISNLLDEGAISVAARELIKNSTNPFRFNHER